MVPIIVGDMGDKIGDVVQKNRISYFLKKNRNELILGVHQWERGFQQKYMKHFVDYLEIGDICNFIPNNDSNDTP